MPGKHKSRAKPRPVLPDIGAEHLTAVQLAEALSVPVGTIRRWRSEGMPIVESVAPERVVFDPSVVVPWVRKHARPSTISKKCFVYFARKGDVIKIGSSIDPKDRLRKMHVEILAVIPGNKQTELAFHELFAHSAIGNEWFNSTPELLELVDSLRAA